MIARTRPSESASRWPISFDRWSRSARAGPFALEDDIRTMIAAVGSPPPAARRIHGTLWERRDVRHDLHAFLHIRVVYDLGLVGCRGTNLDEADLPGRLVRAQPWQPAFIGFSPSDHPGWESLQLAVAGLEIAGCREPAVTARVASLITTALEHPDLGLMYLLYLGEHRTQLWAREHVHRGTRAPGRG